MAFTKINAAGIGTTETVTVDGLTVINDGSFGGNLTVSGVLTYEDVTNVDSVGLITARNGVVVGSGITLSKDGDIFATGITTVSGNVKVGTGITLSPDGDVFFTGIATGNGSGLTALNASNISSGTVPTARLGSGTASSSTFLRGDSSFQTITTDLVGDTSPQLGGDLDTNSFEILLDDLHAVKFGDSSDLSIFHQSGFNQIQSNNTSPIQLRDASNVMLRADPGGAVDLRHNGSVKLATTSSGISVTGNCNVDGNVILSDSEEIQIGNSTDFRIYHDGTNSYIKDVGTGVLRIASDQIQITNAAATEVQANFIEDGAVELYYDNSKKLQTQSGGVRVFGDLENHDDDFIAKDNCKFAAGNSEDVQLYHDGSNSYLKAISGGVGDLYIFADGKKIYLRPKSGEDGIKIIDDGAVELYYDNSLKVQTTSTGMQTVEAVKMTYGGNGVNLKQVLESGVGNTASVTAQVPECVGGGTVTITCMHNGNTSITTTKMFPIMIQGSGTANLGSEIFSINANSTASMSVNAATRGVTVTNNTGNHAKIRVTFDITANA